MEASGATKVILFDLDNTLFDHYHSLRSAIAAIQGEYKVLRGNKREDLIDRYNAALQKAYDKYLCKEITYEEADVLKVQLFFTELDLPEPNLEKVREFRAIYKQTYRGNRRATPGSVEALVRLRENGYHLIIVTNGQIEDQTAKAEAIGIRHLVDRIVTSEEVGCCKPDRRMFQFAIETLSASRHIYMVGDSVDSDIKGPLDAGLGAILYSPITQESQRLLFGEEVPVIHYMGQILPHLGIATPRFEPSFVSQPGKLVIDGMGIDMVTELHHCLHIPKETVVSIADNVGQVLGNISEKSYVSAMSCLEEMIRDIAKVAMPIDETEIQISYPGQGKGAKLMTKPECQVTFRTHSTRAEYVRVALVADKENEATLRDVGVLLQRGCNNLMRDFPRAALRDLRSAMSLVAKIAGVESDLVIKGEKIDE